MKINLNCIYLGSIILFLGCSTSVRKDSKSDTHEKIQKECEAAVKNWIQNYALYPETYKPLKFEEVRKGYEAANGKIILPLQKYSIIHTFELQDTGRKLLSETLKFDILPDFFPDYIHYVEKDVIRLRTRYYPPVYDDFLQFARPFTSDDTLNWQKNNREKLYELEVQFRDNRYNKNHNENIELADSLIEEMYRAYTY